MSVWQEIVPGDIVYQFPLYRPERQLMTVRSVANNYVDCDWFEDSKQRRGTFQRRNLRILAIQDASLSGDFETRVKVEDIFDTSLSLDHFQAVFSDKYPHRIDGVPWLLGSDAVNRCDFRATWLYLMEHRGPNKVRLAAFFSDTADAVMFRLAAS